MTQEQLQALRDQALAKVKADKESIQLKSEVSRLNSIINGSLGSAIAAQEITAETSKFLNGLIEDCTAIVADNPSFNRTTREQRKFNPSRVYNFGSQVGNLVGLLSGIQYSAADHKMLLLAHTGLDEDLIEQTLEAFGQTAYYSANHNIVIPERPYDADKARALVEMIEAKLNINIDKSKLTAATFSSAFELARINAETKRAAAELATMKTINVGA
mgnify:CR=1 FL=1